MNTPKKLMAIINSVESGSNVDLSFFGVDLWPVLRNTIMTFATHQVVKKVIKTTFRQKLMAALSFFSLLVKTPKKDILIITDYKFSLLFNGKLHFKDGSIICSKVSSSGGSALILTQSINASSGAGPPSLFFMVALSYFFAKILNFIYPSKFISKYINKVIAEISRIDSDSCVKKIDMLAVRRNVFFVVVCSAFFSLLLKKLSPKKCYIVCYYSLVGMALCAACNRLGITVIDLQHGVSGRNMRAYGSWVNISQAGYNTLPSIFYCWTRSDKKAIDSWASGSNGNHKASLKGNLWRDFFVSSEVFKQSLRDYSFFEHKLLSYAKVILISAQSSNLAPIFLEFIKRAPSHYAFLIRLHPNVSHDNLMAIEDDFKRIHPSCFAVLATELPVQQVVRYANIHLTEWSALVYDAMFEGVPSIVVNAAGRDYFDDFICLNLVRYCDSVEALLLELKKE